MQMNFELCNGINFCHPSLELIKVKAPKNNLEKISLLLSKNKNSLNTGQDLFKRNCYKYSRKRKNYFNNDTEAQE